MLERLLLVWLTLLGLLAYSWPRWFSGAWDPFVASGPVLDYLFAVTMLAIGSLLPRDEIRQVASRWGTVLGGTAIQYTSMPLLAYAFGRLMGLEGPWMLGIVMVGCVPGAMAGNILTMLGRGNVSYSVSLTTSSTVLSPICVPLALWLSLGRTVEGFPVRETMVQLCWMVVGPVVAGHLLSRRFAFWQRAARRFGSPIANLTILWIIAVVVAKNRANLTQIEPRLVVALLGVNLGGYLAGDVGGRLMRVSEGMRRALTLEIGMQNAGLGTVLIMKLFGDQPSAAIAPALYTFGCMFTGTVLARIWAEMTERREQNNKRNHRDTEARRREEVQNEKSKMKNAK